MLARVDHRRPQVANRRVAERRTVPFAKALVRGGIPPALIAETPAGKSDRQIAPSDKVPDPIDRYAQVIYPVPPPLR